MTRRDKDALARARRVNHDVAKAVDTYGSKKVRAAIKAGWLATPAPGEPGEPEPTPPLRERVLRAFARNAPPPRD